MLYKRFADRRAQYKQKKGGPLRRAYRNAKTARTVAAVRPWSIPRMPIPNAMNTNLTIQYNGAIVTSATQGTTGTDNEWNLNNITKPAVGAATNQPRFYDQYAALYNRYRVEGATVEMRWTTTTTNAVIQCCSFVVGAEDTTTASGKTASFCNEMPINNCSILAPIGASDGTVPPQRFKLSAIEGERYFRQGDDYTAAFGAQPAKIPRLCMAVANMVGTDQLTVQYWIKITYHVHVYDRVTPAQSS